MTQMGGAEDTHPVPSAFGVFGSAKWVMERTKMYRDHSFRSEVFGPNASNFLIEFCTGSLERARELGRKAQEDCQGDEEALEKLAGKLKYVNAYLTLARTYGEQIAIMSENHAFKAIALNYIAMAHAQLEVIEHYKTVA